MILAEKIIKLRKEQGWSQEELAMQLNISRQSVSKWESMASMPDLDKIVKMSELFGVSTDYLLKDEAPEEDSCVNGAAEEQSIRTVSLEEANRYLLTVKEVSGKISNGVSLCILSPVLLMLLTICANRNIIPLSENTAAAMGICLIFVLVAVAVAIILPNGMKLERYEYLEKEPIQTEYGVAGIVQNKQEEYEHTFRTLLVTGVVLCIVSIVPIMLAAAVEDDFFMGCAVIALLFLVAIGVNLIVRTCFISESYRKLLEEGDFTRENKAEVKKNEAFTVFYWCLVLAAYLGISFLTNRWESTWIIWPVTAVLFGAILGLKKMLKK